MRDFDIQRLDLLEPGSEEADEEFDRYQRTLIDLFNAPSEGLGLKKDHGSVGFWAGCLLDFGFNHIGAALPNMAMSDLEEIVTSYFPRKAFLGSPEEAEEAIPEQLFRGISAGFRARG